MNELFTTPGCTKHCLPSLRVQLQLAWDSSASFWTASELSWPSDTFIEWSGISKKKPKQAGCCFGNARKSSLPGDFWHTGSADNWTWRTWPNMTTGQSRPDVTNSNKFWLKSAASVIQNDCSWDIKPYSATCGEFSESSLWISLF